MPSVPTTARLEAFEDMAIICLAVAGPQQASTETLEPDHHVELRMFSPAYGVREDAGTGSAVAPILQHLQAAGLLERGRRIRLEQGHALGRLCKMYGRLNDDGQGAELSGETVVFSTCSLHGARLPKPEARVTATERSLAI